MSFFDPLYFDSEFFDAGTTVTLASSITAQDAVSEVGLAISEHIILVAAVEQFGEMGPGLVSSVHVIATTPECYQAGVSASSYVGQEHVLGAGAGYQSATSSSSYVSATAVVELSAMSAEQTSHALPGVVVQTHLTAATLYEVIPESGVGSVSQAHLIVGGGAIHLAVVSSGQVSSDSSLQAAAGAQGAVSTSEAVIQAHEVGALEVSLAHGSGAGSVSQVHALLSAHGQQGANSGVGSTYTGSSRYFISPQRVLRLGGVRVTRAAAYCRAIRASASTPLV